MGPLPKALVNTRTLFKKSAGPKQVLLSTILILIGGNLANQPLPDHPTGTSQPVAVSIEEIKAYGVVTNGRKDCSDSSRVALFSDAELTERTGSIANHTFVRYDRLSELTHKAYWAPRRQYALPDGERFRIHHDSATGWIDDERLMTFTSTWRERDLERFFVVERNNAVVVYSSGQHGSGGCVVLCVWNKQGFQGTWGLSSAVYNPNALGLYMIPTVDDVLRYDKDHLAIQMRVFGGDAEERWGSFLFYLYYKDELTLAFSRHHNYSADSDYTALESELSLNDLGEPTALMIRKHFAVDDQTPTGLPPMFQHVASDTTIINLLRPEEQRPKD